MNLAIIASIVAAVTLIIGIGIALLLVTFSNQVNRTRAAADQEKSRYRPAATAGLQIPVDGDVDEQLKAAKKLAARTAALTPRGANMRIGQFGPENQPTAFDEPARDPLSAVRIAEFHGWDLWQQGGARGAAAASAPAEAAAVAAPAAAAKTADDLVPGKDYPVIEITDDMSPEDVRKARVANAKAKSAAVKALKEAGEAAGPAAPAAAAAAALAAGAAAPTAVAREPQPGVDYQEIPITEDMSPDEVRKARIANAKAKSAAAKALKEAGATAPAATQAAAATAAEPAPAAAPQQGALAAIPRPDYVEITDDMSPDDVRRARIANAKAKSAYQKALKEAGIDPSTVEA